MNNLVLGFATNQSATDLRIFVNSLRRVYSPAECDCVLIVDEPPAGLATTGPKAVRIVKTVNTYSSRATLQRKARSAMIRALSKAAAGGAPLAGTALRGAMERWHHPCFARWLAYRRFLVHNPAYGQVLLTDVRDVMFQEPFFSKAANRVQFFDQSAVYGVDRCDTDWYREAFGAEGLARVIGRPALCAGTVLGPRDAIIAFIDEFVDWFAQAPFRGVDQANLNGLLLEGAPGFAYQVNANAEGAVATLANSAALATVQIANGKIVNSSGAIVPIVHMYDRHDVTKIAAQAFADAD